jgi:hypothetical protein
MKFSKKLTTIYCGEFFEWIDGFSIPLFFATYGMINRDNFGDGTFLSKE